MRFSCDAHHAYPCGTKETQPRWFFHLFEQWQWANTFCRWSDRTDRTEGKSLQADIIRLPHPNLCSLCLLLLSVKLLPHCLSTDQGHRWSQPSQLLIGFLSRAYIISYNSVSDHGLHADSHVTRSLLPRLHGLSVIATMVTVLVAYTS